MISNKHTIALIAILIFTLSTNAFAHKMTVEASVESGATVVGSAHYGKTPVVEAEVRVIAPDGKILLKTKTNDKGEFTFEVTHRCDLKIEVREGGHKGTTTLPAEDLPADLPPYKP